MTDLFAATDGQTPLDEDERQGLIPPAVATRGDLNLVEEENNTEAREWAFNARRGDLLTDGFIRELHRRMFNRVWTWAGTYRTSLKNLGAPPEQIAVRVRELCRDAGEWARGGAAPGDPEAAILHHRLVTIHPFSNGNGRHGRLFTDLFLSHHGAPIGSWGAVEAERDQESTQALRNRYISSLRAADKGDYRPLTLFIRS